MNIFFKNKLAKLVDYRNEIPTKNNNKGIWKCVSFKKIKRYSQKKQ